MKNYDRENAETSGQQRTKELLGESESRHRELVQNANSAIIRWKSDGTLTFINEYALAFFGYSREELLGRHVGILLPKQDSTGTDLTGLVRDVVEHPERYVNNINENICKDGQRVWVSWTNKPLLDERGNVAEILAIGSDITDLKRAEEEILEREQKYRSLFENMLNGFAYHMIIVDDAGKPVDYLFLEVNENFEKMTGLKRENVIGKTATEVIPDIMDSAFDWIGEYGKVALEGTELRTEQFSEALDRWFSISAYRVKERYFAVVFEDITERKLATKRISDIAKFPSENPYVVMRAAKDGSIIYINESGLKYLDEAYRPGRTFPAPWNALIAESFDSGVNRTFEMERSGSILSFIIVPVIESGYINLYGVDITERKRAEEKVRYQNNILEGVNRILREALVSDSVEELGKICLSAAAAVTGSRFGFIGEINSRGELDDIAISDMGWTACEMKNKTGHGRASAGFRVHGIYGRVILEGKPFFTNSPASHPDSIGLPAGHPPLEAFIGAPLIHEGRTIGMVALANREGGYCSEDLEALEILATAIVQVFMRKKAETELKEKQKLLEDITSTTPGIIYIFDLEDHHLVFANPGLPRYLGYEVNDIRLLGENVYEAVIHPDDLPVLGEVMAKLAEAADREAIEYEIRVRHRKDRWIWLYNTNIVFSRAADGRSKQILGIAHDITKKKEDENELKKYHQRLEELVDERTALLQITNKKLEREILIRRQAEDKLQLNYEALRQSNELLEQIFSNIYICIAYMDRDFNIIRVNTAYALTDGRPPEFFIGKNHFDLYPDEENERIFRGVVEKGGPFFVREKAFEYRGNPEKGVTYWDWSLKPVKDARGAVQGLVLSLLDVTEKKQSEAEALKAAHLACLGEIAAGVAHEINNPINGIINYAQILLDEPGKKDLVADLSKRVIKEGTRIENIVKSLLSFARQKEQVLEPAEVSIILEETLILMKSYLDKRNIRVASHIRSDIPLVLVNQQQIQQVFINLISNASYALEKRYPGYSPDKIIEITAEKKLADGRVWVEVIFQDYGTGIPADQLRMVMNPFFSTKRPKEGTGLGLSISLNIIRNHGGTIAIESVEDEFTRVSVTLPALENDTPSVL